jgi:hypothetical protein
VLEARDDLGLAMEAIPPTVPLARVEQQRLERHVALQTRLEGLVDHGHPTATQKLDTLVLTELQRVQAVTLAHHVAIHSGATHPTQPG